MKLRDYQQAAINSCFEYLNKEEGNQLIIAPTGSGKSLVVAGIAQKSIELHEECVILILSHRQEILEQNADKIKALCPEFNIGIFSASLGKKKIRQVTVAAIQSLARHEFEEHTCPDLVIIDECHLVPKKGDGQYLQVINRIKNMKPWVRIIGLTATPYRLDSGLLTRGKEKIFDAISYDISIKQLLKEGYLCPLISKSSATQADTSVIKKKGGEYIAEAAAAVMSDHWLTNQALNEVEQFAHDRKSIIFFCTTRKHVNLVTEALNQRNVYAQALLGDTKKNERERLITDFKNQKIRALVSCEVLTTGFDAPNVDCIVLLRPTASAGLYVQMLGRGLRTYPGKKNCLVLDYGGNLIRHGKIDDINIKTYSDRENDKQEINGKICPECRELLAIAEKECSACGYVYPPTILNHGIFAEEGSFLTDEADKVIKYGELKKARVDIWQASIHSAKGGKRILKVRIGNALLHADEYICLEHEKNIRWLAQKKWNKLGGGQLPENCEAALKEFSSLKKPKYAWLEENGKFLNVASLNYDDTKFLQKKT